MRCYRCKREPRDGESFKPASTFREDAVVCPDCKDLITPCPYCVPPDYEPGTIPLRPERDTVCSRHLPRHDRLKERFARRMARLFPVRLWRIIRPDGTNELLEFASEQTAEDVRRSMIESGAAPDIRVEEP
jgi:hypothetical protein